MKTVTVGADGSILITGLGTNTPYWAVGLVGGKYRWVPFMTSPAPTIENVESTDLADSALLARQADLTALLAGLDSTDLSDSALLARLSNLAPYALLTDLAALASTNLTDSALLARLTNLVPITPLSGSKTWDPPSVTIGSATSTTLTVTGAAMGDAVAVSFSLAVPAGCILVGYVTAADTVTVTLYNPAGGGTQDLASGTLRVKVFKQ